MVFIKERLSCYYLNLMINFSKFNGRILDIECLLIWWGRKYIVLLWNVFLKKVEFEKVIINFYIWDFYEEVDR